MLLCFAAWAGPTYNTDELTLAFSDPQHQHVLRVVKRDLERMRVRTERPLAALQTSELLGLLVATQTPQRGGEFDLRLAGDRVTVWEEGRRWKVSRIPDTLSANEGPSMRSIAGRYPIGAVSAVPGSRWEPQTTFAIDTALSKLTMQELAPLHNIRWVRRRSAKHRMHQQGVHAATFIVTDLDVRIEIYDDAAAPSHRFIGPLDQPATPTTGVILHEIAHALSDAPFRALALEYTQQRQLHNEQSAQHSAELEALNRSIAAYNHSPRPGRLPHLKAEGARLRTWATTLNRRATELNNARMALESSAGVSPMALLFAEEIGGSPTRYGTTSRDEAFAEAFMLYKLDPEALERAQPGALAWFRAGKHISPP